jgi:hypothetical protein
VEKIVGGIKTVGLAAESVGDANGRWSGGGFVVGASNLLRMARLLSPGGVG